MTQSVRKKERKPRFGLKTCRKRKFLKDFFGKRIYPKNNNMKTSKILLNDWMGKHCRDIWVIRAQQKNLRARSGFKIQQLQEKLHFIKKGQCLLELGAAPGSWTQQIVELIGKEGYLVAVDRLTWKPVDGVICLSNCDFTTNTGFHQIKNQLKDRRLNGIISDACPNITGHSDIDYFAIAALISRIWTLYHPIMLNGFFLFKCFYGAIELLKRQSGDIFTKASKVNNIRVESSRTTSSEIYIFCQY